MKTIRSIFCALAGLLLSGCYAHFQAPAPELSVPLNGASADRAGSASCQQILWAFAFGDCSVKAAMEDGSIDRLHHVDSEIKVILWGVFSEWTLRTWGE